jgi:hypothetical protein
MEELDEMISFLAAIKIQQKALLKSEAEAKEAILATMEANDVEEVNTEYGTIRIQERKEKEYSLSIQEAEDQLKEDKKLANDLGDYEVVAIKKSLVLTLPKDSG